MNTTSLGNTGEDLATEYLRAQGFKIIDRNWKTRYCEIDIIAEMQKTIYFVEVKTRKNTTYGGGLDYVTPKKLQQMQFAATMWVQTNDWKGSYQLAAISVDANVITFVDDIAL